MEEIADAGQQGAAVGEVVQQVKARVQKMGSWLKSVGPLILGLVVLGGVAAGIAAWFYHAHEVQRREAEAATAREEYARSVVAGVMKSWQADDRWEDLLSSPGGRGRTPYTIELEKALIHDRPLIAFGRVDDLGKSGEPQSSIVSVSTQTQARGLDLRLSLLSPPEITNAILTHKGRSSETFVFAVKINSVEKIASPPDSSAEDYFLGHGVLLEAEPLGLRRPPKQSAQSNQ